MTRSALQHAVASGRLQRLERGAYLEGPEPPTPLERALGVVVAVDGVASGCLAGALHQLDSVQVNDGGAVVTVAVHRNSVLRRVRRSNVVDSEITDVDGIRCTNGLRTLVDLAGVLDDLRWEQALESALHKELLGVDDLESVGGVRNIDRIRRVLALRPPGAPPTESLLETLMVQLVRREPSLPTPSRQVVVLDRRGEFVARVDLAWPEHGIFLELDGQQHLGQPVYDASRQTAVVATTGWLPGRFTWHEVNRIPRRTCRRLCELFEQAARFDRTA
jgi:hypothetical protein